VWLPYNGGHVVAWSSCMCYKAARSLMQSFMGGARLVNAWLPGVFTGPDMVYTQWFDWAGFSNVS
jgi:uncharacterized protein (AIM24 family)